MAWLALEEFPRPRRVVGLAGALGLVILGRFSGVDATLPEQFPYQLSAAPGALALGPGFSVATINALHVVCGQWLASQTPPAATVGADDVGAVGYFSERQIVDTIGLVTPAVARARRAGQPLGPILRASGVDYVATLRPHTLPD